jgi:hypothetical protein
MKSEIRDAIILSLLSGMGSRGVCAPETLVNFHIASHLRRRCSSKFEVPSEIKKWKRYLRMWSNMAAETSTLSAPEPFHGITSSTDNLQVACVCYFSDLWFDCVLL